MDVEQAFIERDTASSFDLEEPRGRSILARGGRRLDDKLLACVHLACDTGDYEVAEQMLQVIEIMASRIAQPDTSDRCKHIENLVAAYERLWSLRNRARAAY